MASSRYPKTESASRVTTGDVFAAKSVRRVGETEPGGVAEEVAQTEWRMSNYRNLVARTVEVFGDEIKASRWLSAPSAELGGKTPIELARGFGYDVGQLEPILTRIEHGVYI
jgi:uncharacterized protein (DUF2384 family)